MQLITNHTIYVHTSIQLSLSDWHKEELTPEGRLVSTCMRPSIYRVQQKSSPLEFCTVFSATVWDFNVKFYSVI